MTKSLCIHETEDLCKVLDKLAHDTEEMAARAFDGLLKHSRRSLEEAERIGHNIETETRQLTQKVLAAREEFGLLNSTVIVAVTNELQKMRYSLDKMVGSIRSKIEEGVLFSDKAVVELKDFFNAVLQGLRNVHDLILTGNPVLIEHIVRQVEEFEETARKYAEEHEERLIKGICLPKSSLIYLLILDSLKDILWYIRGIAVAFRELA